MEEVSEKVKLIELPTVGHLNHQSEDVVKLLLLLIIIVLLLILLQLLQYYYFFTILIITKQLSLLTFNQRPLASECSY